MIKNMTRKSLAIGSASALTVAGLVGVAAPAQASGIVLEPTVGTSYSVPLGAAFELNTYYASADNPYNDAFDVVVVDADGGLASVEIFNGATSIQEDTAANTDGEFEVSVASPAVGAEYTVVVTPDAAADATFSVTVVSSFARGAASATRTVTFHEADDYTWNLSFDTAHVGDDALTASVTTTPALNLEQIESMVAVGFASVASNGNLTAVGDGSTVSGDNVRFSAGEAVAYSSDDSNLAATTTGTVAVTAQTYAAAVLFDGEQVTDNALQVVGAATIDTLTDPAATAGADVSGTDIRSEGSSFEVTVDATLSGDAAAAGEIVTLTVSGSLSTDASITVAGTTYVEGDDAVEVEVAVDADGTASLTIAYADVAEGDTVTVVASAQAATDTTETFSFVDTAASALVDYNLVGAGAVMKVTSGSSYSLAYVALDNFGQPLTGDFYVRLDNGTTVSQKKISNGVASFALTDDADATEDYSATLWTVASNGVDFTQVGAFEVTTTPTVGTSNAVADITATASGSPAALLGADLENADTRLGETAPTTDAGAAVTISGTATDASGVVTWSNVTVSAPGVMFEATAGTKTVYAVGSITVKTSAVGAYSVKAYSNTSGEHTVTVAAGSASETVDIEFDAAAAGDGATLVIDAPVAVAPGSTVIATATLTDEYGNAVAASGDYFDVAYDGPGLSVVVPTAFDANGEAKIAYFLGANDSGTITVTFSYSPTGNGTFDADEDIVVQKTIYIGAAPSAEVATWTKNLGDGTVKMYAKNIVGAGKVQFMLNGEEIAWVRAVDATDPKLRAANGFYYLVRTVELVEGQKNALEIYVDGERTTRTAYTY